MDGLRYPGDQQLVGVTSTAVEALPVLLVMTVSRQI